MEGKKKGIKAMSDWLEREGGGGGAKHFYKEV